MNNIIDNLEAVLIEADKAKGWKWVSEEALWVTWSLEKFGKSFIVFVTLGRMLKPSCSHPNTSNPSSIP